MENKVSYCFKQFKDYQDYKHVEVDETYGLAYHYFGHEYRARKVYVDETPIGFVRIDLDSNKFDWVHRTNYDYTSVVSGEDYISLVKFYSEYNAVEDLVNSWYADVFLSTEVAQNSGIPCSLVDYNDTLYDTNDGQESTDSKWPEWKYNEGSIVDELKEYIASTYGEHYAGDNGVQLMDVFYAEGIAEQYSRGNAMKYVQRYGKKAGYNRKDVLKAMHYCIFLLHATELEEAANG